MGCSLLLSACTQLSPQSDDYTTIDTTNHQQLRGLHQTQNPKKLAPKDINDIRLTGIKEVAMTLAAQGALAKRSQEINLMLENNHQQLDQIYNFNALLLNHNIMPPVMTEGKATFNKTDNNAIRIADKTYRIVQQAQFITAPPNWRNYLSLTYEKPEIPDYNVLPREESIEEVKHWQQGIDEGWKAGSKQANQIFAENIARLQRDYNGIVLYRKLLNNKMISAPTVAEMTLGVTGGGDELTINDRFKRITNVPSLNAQSEEWRPIIAQSYTSITQYKPEKPVVAVPKMQPTMTSDEDPSTYVK